MRRDLLRRVEKLEAVAGGKEKHHAVLVHENEADRFNGAAFLASKGIACGARDTVVAIQRMCPRAGDDLALPKYLYSY